MEVNDDLKKLYSDYYHDEKVIMKRKVAARQTLDHLNSILPRRNYHSIIDVGAGDGSVLEEIEKANIGEVLHAVEISESGCACIKEKNLAKLQSVNQFDGYKIPGNHLEFELGIAIHVLEHVEHERAFILEMARTCEYLYIEVPLELTFKVRRNVQIGAQFGHINYYNGVTFQNLLKSCGLEVLEYRAFSTSPDYENLLGGRFKGGMKHGLRSVALNMFPNIAPWMITYMGGAYCKSQS